MGILDTVFRDMAVTGGVFARCAYHGDWQMALEARGGQMLFHVIKDGGTEFELLSPNHRRQRVSLAAGDIVVLPYGDAHRLWRGESQPVVPKLLAVTDLNRFTNLNDERTGDPTVFLCGYYQLDQIRSHPLLRRLPRAMHIRAGHDAGQMASIIALIDREAHTSTDGSQTIMNRLTEPLLIYLLRAWTQQQQTPVGLLAAFADPVVSRALAAMHSKPEHHWTVAILGREARASRAKFAKRFQDLLGYGPIEYLKQLRMTRAMELLRDTRMPLTRIAEQSGYESAAAFSKAFKKYTGLSPQQYQRGQPIAKR
jgi:AraC-like DNA-binding protein